MERKTKHRILGILVVIALVVVLLPLFESRREFSSETTLVKAPPFPDQSVQVSSTTPEQPLTNQQAASLPESKSATQSANNGINQQPDDTISSLHPSIVNTQVPDITHPNQSPATVPADVEHNDQVTELAPTRGPDSNEAQIQTTSDIKPVAEKISDDILSETTHAPSKIKKTFSIVKRPRTIKMQSASAVNSLDNNGLLRLKNAAWVIQIGSYKNKANALRLVNQLRANGYRAFIQQVSNTIGESTRVFVGPENKQTAARALASQLETNLHIRGIVISYKPLTL